jgi:Predicted helicase
MVDKSYKAVEGCFQDYFKEIRKRYSTGDYTEGTLRTPLENFIESLDKNFDLIQEPKRVQKLGAPDFKAFNKAVKIGYIETKDIDKNLDNELESEQIKKYRESIDNIILTNYSRFILLRNNQKLFDINLFGLSDLGSLRHVITDEKIKDFLGMVDIFFTYRRQTIRSPKELANELSKKARLLKDLAKEQLEEDLLKVKNNEEASSIYDFYEGLKELIKDVNTDDCVDAYAQTITYSLFLAKTNCPDKLDRSTAVSYIPKSVGVIKRIFINISGDSLPSNLSWIVDEVVDILNASDIKNILSEIDFRGKKDRDPFTFFYEDFLSQYDPKKRKHWGIFYTPRPVVNFIVNSVNQILKRDFNKIRGFAEDDVTVLDPCVGTGTFLWLAFTLTLVELKNSGLRGLIKQKTENHILKDFYGLEILVTPYIISHLKLTMVLKKWFYEFKDNDRIQVYLTNTLDPSQIEYFMSPFLKEITKESETANRLKLEKPILVIIGNPPYSVSSSNKSKWIMEKMEDYKKDLNERNIQPLSDDYIKFIRFAQWKIEQNKQGVVGYITNNSYLDGIIHRQMRKELLEAFDRIYILNLHGSSRREELTEKKDENVFDIQQGVAIVLFIKNDKFKDKKVFYCDLYGKREDKYLWLDRNRINTVEWQELKPEEPYYFFIKKDLSKIKIYEKFYSVKQIFRNFNMGVATGKDKIFVDFSNKNLLSKLSKLKPKPEQDLIKPYYYRPFDIRSVYYDKTLLQRARYNIMKHFLSENIGLCLVRQGKNNR